MTNQTPSQTPSDEQREFENTVRRLARSLWPSAANQGAQIVDGQERDGVFETEEVLHLLECTVSRKKEKAENDIQKLLSLWKKKRSSKPVKCWFVTREEPTADQRAVAEEFRKKDRAFLIDILSIDQFRAKLIDIDRYLDCRRNYRFGSMQESPKIAKFEYVPFDIMTSTGKSVSLSEMIANVLRGVRIVISGDYGAGKSTTMRELFLQLSKQKIGDEAYQFPVLLNLRDHYGQTDATEALERHARKIGFESGASLVRAWRAGYAVIMLDGFDEIAIPGWQGQADRLKKLRRDSMQLVREFVKDTPSDRGLIVSGRQNYFDSDDEMRNALGFGGAGNQALFVTIQDFNEEQVQQYLVRRGWKQSVPSWLPTRPLLLSYLISKDLLESVLETNVNIPPAQGWDVLLSRICDREAILEVGIDGSTIRRLIERLASKARVKADGLGPVSAEDILRTFQEVCHYVADDRASILLQRLPGLGVPNDEDGARKFIDLSLSDAARSGDVVRYIASPFECHVTVASEWQAELGEIGLQMVSEECASRCVTQEQISVALREAIYRHSSSVLASDLVRLSQELDCAYPDSKWIVIRDVMIQELEFDATATDLSRVVYQDCIIRNLTLASDVNYSMLPRFKKCLFVVVDGMISEHDMPNEVFAGCVVDEFKNTGSTNNQVLELDLGIGERVLIVILRKLYVQAGSGRRTSALYRGLDHKDRTVVPKVLHMLKQEGLVVEATMNQNTVWLPVRSHTRRVQELLRAPFSSPDPLLESARRLAT